MEREDENDIWVKCVQYSEMEGRVPLEIIADIELGSELMDLHITMPLGELPSGDQG